LIQVRERLASTDGLLDAGTGLRAVKACPDDDTRSDHDGYSQERSLHTVCRLHDTKGNSWAKNALRSSKPFRPLLMRSVIVRISFWSAKRFRLPSLHSCSAGLRACSGAVTRSGLPSKSTPQA